MMKVLIVPKEERIHPKQSKRHMRIGFQMKANQSAIIPYHHPFGTSSIPLLITQRNSLEEVGIIHFFCILLRGGELERKRCKK